MIMTYCKFPGDYIFKAILCHRVEGQYHPDDGHPLQKVFTACVEEFRRRKVDLSAAV